MKPSLVVWALERIDEAQTKTAQIENAVVRDGRSAFTDILKYIASGCKRSKGGLTDWVALHFKLRPMHSLKPEQLNPRPMHDGLARFS